MNKEDTDREFRKRVDAMETSRRRGMAEYQYRRIRYPYQSPLVFDCRFEGAAEQIVHARYQSYLNAFHEAATSLNQTGRFSCDLDLCTPEVIRLLKEAKKKGLDPIKMCVALKYERVRIAKEVSAEIGRDATADEVRRMGLGDQIVLFSLLHSIEADLGGGSVSVIFDPLYPGTESLLRMSGLLGVPIPPGVDLAEVVEEGATLIDMRRHMLEHPLCDGVPCYYGEEVGDPSRQTLWNLGWEHSVPRHLVGHPRLTPPKKARMEARAIVKGRTIIACQPLEMTRLNKYATAGVYSAVLQMLNVHEILLGCSPRDRSKLDLFIKEMDLPKEYHTAIITKGLDTWTAVMSEAQHIVTGNTSGMWLAFSTETPVTVLSKSDRLHGEMWNVRPQWFDEGRRASVRILS